MLLFARPREVAGAGVVDLELPAGSTAADAFADLTARTPALGPMRPLLRCAVNGEYAAWEAPLDDGAELALIPPTAGG